MINPSLETPLELPGSARASSWVIRCVVVAAAIALCGAVDFLLHVVWLPTVMSDLAVQQMRPDDTVAEAVRAAAQWANWSHTVLGTLVVLLTAVLLFPLFRHGRQTNSAL